MGRDDGRGDSRDRGRDADRGGGDGGKRGQDGGDGCTLWIGGLPNDITEDRIKDLCGRQGGVTTRVAIRKSKNDTYCFASFTNANDAKESKRALDQSNPWRTGVIKVAAASRKVPDGPGDNYQSYGEGHGGFRSIMGPVKGKGKGWGKGGGKRRSRTRSRSRRRSRSRSRSRRRERSSSRNPRQRVRSPSISPRKRSTNSRDRGRSRAEDDRKGEQPRSRSRGGRSSPRRKQESLTWAVHLSQLPRDMERAELKDIVAEFGPIHRMELHRESEYKCGTVEYLSSAEAKRCEKALHNRRVADWGRRVQAYVYPGESP